jgi:hypothetical protein
MTDERLRDLLLIAMSPAAGDGPARDLWPRMASRFEQAPRWSYIDLSLAAAVIAALAIFPQWFWPLAYHL